MVQFSQPLLHHLQKKRCCQRAFDSAVHEFFCLQVRIQPHAAAVDAPSEATRQPTVHASSRSDVKAGCSMWPMRGSARMWRTCWVVHAACRLLAGTGLRANASSMCAQRMHGRFKSRKPFAIIQYRQKDSKIYMVCEEVFDRKQDLLMHSPASQKIFDLLT